jgi:hypothetical protein
MSKGLGLPEVSVFRMDELEKIRKNYAKTWVPMVQSNKLD